MSHTHNKTDATSPAYPTARPRRLRYNPLVRELVRETELSAHDLILPLFVRPGGVIAIGGTDDRPDYDYAGDVRFVVGELGDGGEAQGAVHSAGGEEALRVDVRRAGGTLQATLTAGAPKRWRLQLAGVKQTVRVTGGRTAPDPLGVVIEAEDGARQLSIELAS